MIFRRENLSNLEIASSINMACVNSDAIILITDWEEFYNLDFLELSKIMRNPRFIFDTRNIINSKEATNSGFRVWKLGDGIFQ